SWAACSRAPTAASACRATCGCSARTASNAAAVNASRQPSVSAHACSAYRSPPRAGSVPRNAPGPSTSSSTGVSSGAVPTSFTAPVATTCSRSAGWPARWIASSASMARIVVRPSTRCSASWSSPAKNGTRASALTRAPRLQVRGSDSGTLSGVRRAISGDRRRGAEAVGEELQHEAVLAELLVDGQRAVPGVEDVVDDVVAAGAERLDVVVDLPLRAAGVVLAGDDQHRRADPVDVGDRGPLAPQVADLVGPAAEQGAVVV